MTRYTRTSANEFSRSVKLDRLENYAERQCEWDGPPGKEGSEPRCPQKLTSGNVIFDHWRSNEELHALGEPPDNSVDNCRCLCTGHNKVKGGLEAKARATSRSKKAAVYGAKTVKHPLPFGRNSRLMKRLDGTVVDRDTGEPI